MVWMKMGDKNRIKFTGINPHLRQPPQRAMPAIQQNFRTSLLQKKTARQAPLRGEIAAGAEDGEFHKCELGLQVTKLYLL